MHCQSRQWRDKLFEWSILWCEHKVRTRKLVRLLKLRQPVYVSLRSHRLIWLSLQLGTEASNETHKRFLSLPELNHSSQIPASFPNFAVLKFANGYSARIVDCQCLHWFQSCMIDMCHLPYIWQRTLYYHLPDLYQKCDQSRQNLPK